MDLPNEKTAHDEDDPLKSLDQQIAELRKSLGLTPGSYSLTPEEQDNLETEFRNHSRMRKALPQQTDD